MKLYWAVTVNVQSVIFPEASVAEQVTVVVPAGKDDTNGGFPKGRRWLLLARLD